MMWLCHHLGPVEVVAVLAIMAMFARVRRRLNARPRTRKRNDPENIAGNLGKSGRIERNSKVRRRRKRAWEVSRASLWSWTDAGWAMVVSASLFVAACAAGFGSLAITAGYH